MLWIPLVLTLLRVGPTRAEWGLEVTTQNGDVHGRWVNDNDDKVIGRAFLGVPFAQPPVDNRRFRMPEQMIPWEGVKDCTEMEARCIQTNELLDWGNPTKDDSEDCLYLNVITPAAAPPDPLPVMVFIHGGGFNYGSAVEYGVEGPCERLVSRGVILVVIQYRLGVFGFLSTSDATVPGNLGLWDQIEALRWVRDNIEGFGGDPGRVTIFGESAGAMSVSALHYSPAAQDLFHQGISISGTAWTLSGVESLVGTGKEMFERFVGLAGCTEGSSEEKVQCLRELPLERLVELQKSAATGSIEEGVLPIYWGVVIDGYLLPDSIDKLGDSLQPKPAMYGSTDLEMATLMVPPPQLDSVRTSGNPMVIKNESAFDIETFNTMLATIVPHNQYQNVELARDLVRLRYLHTQGDDTNNTFVLESYLKMVGDLWFNIPIYHEASAKTRVNSSVYLYSFDYYNAELLDGYRWKGAIHGSDLIYVFNTTFDIFNFTWTEEDKRVSDAITSAFTNFAISGDPSPTNNVWRTFSSMEDSPTYHFAGGAEEGLHPRNNYASTSLWAKILPAVKKPCADQKERRKDEL